MQLTRLSFVLATCSSTLYAADTAIELPTVNVQATAPARTVSEIGAAQIEREQPADLKALLKNQPGVAVSALQRTRQGNDSVNIRGLSGNRVGMSMDGIPLPEAQESRIFASAGLAFGRGNFIEPTALRATTIARGAEAEGLAGSVQFKTLEPADVLQNENFGAYVQSGYQSTDSSRHIGGGAAASTGIWQGMLMGTYRLGHETETRGHVGGDGQSRTEADPQDYNSRYFLTKHHFQIAPEHRLSLTGEHLRRHQWLDQRSQLGLTRKTAPATAKPATASRWHTATKAKRGICSKSTAKSTGKTAAPTICANAATAAARAPTPVPPATLCGACAAKRSATSIPAV